MERRWVQGNAIDGVSNPGKATIGVPHRGLSQPGGHPFVELPDEVWPIAAGEKNCQETEKQYRDEDTGTCVQKRIEFCLPVLIDKQQK